MSNIEKIIQVLSAISNSAVNYMEMNGKNIAEVLMDADDVENIQRAVSILKEIGGIK